MNKILCCSVRIKGKSSYMIHISQLKQLWFMKLTERTCLKHTIFILNRKRDFHFVTIHSDTARKGLKHLRWTMLGLNTVTLCMCTLFRTTMNHIRVHSRHFSSIQWPRSKTSSIHVHIHANDVVCFTCTNWHKKHRNQTNHQYHQHVVAVEKNCTVITCTCTQIPRMSGVSLVTSGQSFMLH